MMPFNSSNWYWRVGAATDVVYSSAARGTVSVSDATYQAWLASGGLITPIDSMDSLVTVLRNSNVPPYHLVPTRAIVDRLNTAGKLAAARAALDAADLYTRERWNNRLAIYADDPTAVAMLQAIGADPAVILAPE